MSSKPGHLVIPERTYLSTQAATTLRRAIEEGRWREFLPSERRLCSLLRVSRPTIRAAVHLLAEEGWLKVQQGRRSRLLAGRKSRRAQRSRLVVLVSTQPVSRWPQSIYHSITEMRVHLTEQGFATEFLLCQARSTTAQCQKIETFLGENPVLCWVLLSVPKDLQLWFSAQRLPALVVGTCHPGVSLPSLDIDYRAVCRHAAGLFLSKGHRRLALIVRDSDRAGDLASEEGFCDAVAHHDACDQARARVVRHNGTVQHLHLRLDDLFNGPQPPTALLVAQPQHTIRVLTYLARRGLTVPGQVSLIGRDRELLFDDAIAQYKYDGDAFGRQLSHLMLQMVGQGCLAPVPTLVFPTYHPADTVRALR
ncbi:MAG: substrate-binding domain-containing protein [Verrucomicrobia bacterium]|nr:substrate-binding domain-containing protein [Verrucomicrobiota bacterium]